MNQARNDPVIGRDPAVGISDAGHKSAGARYSGFAVLTGSAFLLNGFLLEYASPHQGVGELAGGIGAMLLAIPLCVKAFRSLRSERQGLEVLVLLAVIACFALGDYALAGVVALLMLGALVLKDHTASGAWTAVESLFKMAPKKARRLNDDGSWEEIPVGELSAGEQVQILPGDVVPADGTIEEGISALSEASITGESIPVDKGAGESVFAGTINESGALKVRVDKVGEDTTLARVRRLIARARESRPPIADILDRYTGWYIPVVVMLAGLVLFLTDDMSRAISTIVAACPVALVIALPSATVAALACAYREGILVKKPHDLEQVTSISAVVVDKTGTLTLGELGVDRIIPSGGMTEETVLSCAASVARFSRHPASQALTAFAKERASAAGEAGDVREEPGKGLVGQLHGKEVRLGRPGFLEAAGIDCTIFKEPLKELAGFSVIALAYGGEAVGLFALQDRVRPEAKRAVSALREEGVEKVIMVTGDRKEVAERIGAELDVDEVFSECLPEQKLSIVRTCRSEGYHVMVAGDGVNDAPALASGDIGVAMGAGGSEIALESAGVAIMRNDINALASFLRLGKRNRSVTFQNLLIGVVLVLCGVFLAGFGYLNPVSAAVLQNAGAVGVLLSSARLVRERGDGIRS